jgi:hypothetical protein
MVNSTFRSPSCIVTVVQGLPSLAALGPWSVDVFENFWLLLTAGKGGCCGCWTGLKYSKIDGYGVAAGSL